MNKLAQLGFLSFIAIFACSTIVRALEINQQQYCYLKIKESEQSTFKILVPNDKVKTIIEKLDVIGLNCRGKN